MGPNQTYKRFHSKCNHTHILKKRGMGEIFTKDNDRQGLISKHTHSSYNSTTTTTKKNKQLHQKFGRRP